MKEAPLKVKDPPIEEPHNADLVAAGGCRADGVIVVDLLDGRGFASIEGDAVLNWICFYWKCI